MKSSNRFNAAFALLMLLPVSGSLKAADTAAAVPTATEILAKYQEAAGGKAALEKVKTRVMKGDIEVSALGVSGPFESKAKAPNQQVSKIEFGGFGSMREGFDGKTAWSKAPGLGLRNKSGGELARVQRSTLFPRELKLAEAYAKLESKGAAKVGDKAAWVVEGSVKDGKPDRLYFDQKTGLLLREETIVPAITGEMQFQIDFDDYRDVDGVKIAFIMRVPQPAEVGFRIKFREIQQNVEIPDSDFAPPKD